MDETKRLKGVEELAKGDVGKERREVEEEKERGQEGPEIIVVKEGEGREGFTSFFGVRVKSIMDVSYGGKEAFGEAMAEQMRLGRCLLDGSVPGQSVELRYIVHPDAWNWTRGQVDMAFLFVNSEKAPEAARRRAEEMWENISPILNMHARLFESEPVTNVEELGNLRHPFEARDIVEITRREEALNTSGREVIYRIFPFIPNPGSMEALVSGLLMQRVPASFCVSLRTISLSERERLFLAGRLMDGGSRAGFILENGNGGHENRRDREQWDGSAYLMKIHLVSSSQLPASLVELVGGEITLPPKRLQTSDAEESGAEGGFSCHRPAKGAEIERARRNLDFQGVDCWAPTSAPEGLERLRYIFTPQETLPAFRLPVAAGGREIPGIDSKIKLPVSSFDFSRDGILVGEVGFGSTKEEMRLGRHVRRLHTWIQGATGMGKSTVIQNMALSDIRNGDPVVVFDFHGDLISGILRRWPEERAPDDLVYFNPADEVPVKFNPLAYDRSSRHKDLQREKIVDGVISWLRMEYRDDTMGPVFFQNVRAALLLVLSDEDEPATLKDFMDVFFDKKFLKAKLEKCNNPMVRRFFESVYNAERYAVAGDGPSMLQYVVSKFSPLVDVEMTRKVFCGRGTGLDMRTAMDRGQVVLIDISKGLIGSYTSIFMATMLLGRLEAAALSRADIPEDKRRDVFVYIDEALNIQSDSFYQLISEMRKFRVNLTLSTQHSSQFSARMKDGIISNCGNFIIFKCGITDALCLEPMLYPYKGELLTRLSAYQAVVRTQVGGDTKLFMVDTLPPRLPGRGEESAKRLVSQSRRKFMDTEKGRSRSRGQGMDAGRLEKLRRLTRI